MMRYLIGTGIVLFCIGWVEASRLEGRSVAAPSPLRASIFAADLAADFSAKLEKAPSCCQCCQIGCLVKKRGVTRVDLCPIDNRPFEMPSFQQSIYFQPIELSPSGTIKVERIEPAERH